MNQTPSVHGAGQAGQASWLEPFLRDLRYGARNLRRSGGFALVAVSTLALGIGANSAVFSVVDSVLLRPLPYPHPDRLVRVFDSSKAQPRFPVSPLNLVDLRRETRTLEGLAGYTREDLQVSDPNRPQRLAAMRVTHDFFRVLGTSPALGRAFDAREELTNARVVILSHQLWRTRFGSDPAVIGRTLRLNGDLYEVVGVVPPGFRHVGGDYRTVPHGDTVDLWWPLDLNPERVRRGWHYVNTVGRMKPGARMADVQADLGRISAELARRYPDTNRNWSSRVTPLEREIVGRAGPGLVLMLVAATLVLLIACVNLANLLLARGSVRMRELGVRSALGAGRGALMRVVFAESLVLAAAGGLLGAALAVGGVGALRRIMPTDFPRLHDIAVNPSVLLYTAAISLATACLFGLAPALRGARVDPATAMAQGGQRTGTAGGLLRLRGLLAAGQVALASALLFGTGLLARSMSELNRTDPGFDPRGVLTFTLNPAGADYSKPEQVARYFDAVLRQVRQVPGVTAAGAATAVPWTGWDENTGFDIVNDTERRSTNPEARFGGASPGFLRAMGIPLVKGRDLAESDSEKTPKVILVNEALERKFFPKGALGRKLDLWNGPCEIVGVFSDIRDRPADLEAVPAFLYPVAQQPFANLTVAVRANGDPLALAGALRAAIRPVNPEVPMAELRSMDSIVRTALAQRRFILALTGVFAGLAILLAGIGTYGVLAYLVAQRRREVAIRVALGAAPGGIVRGIVAQGLAVGAGGLAVGLALGFGGARLLASMLYGVSRFDALTIFCVVGATLGFAAAASAVPARRAARVDPISVLREQ